MYQSVAEPPFHAALASIQHPHAALTRPTAHNPICSGLARPSSPRPRALRAWPSTLACVVTIHTSLN